MGGMGMLGNPLMAMQSGMGGGMRWAWLSITPPALRRSSWTRRWWGRLNALCRGRRSTRRSAIARDAAKNVTDTQKARPRQEK